MNDEQKRQKCQGDQNLFDNYCSKNDNHFHSLYQRVGTRTGTIIRLMWRQHSPENAEAIGFAICGNPLEGGQSHDA